jgi:hypothetical protein
MTVIDAPELNTQALLSDGLQNVYWIYVSSQTTVHTGLRLDNWMDYAGMGPASVLAQNPSNVFNFSWYDSGYAFSCSGNQSDCPLVQKGYWSGVEGACVRMQPDFLGNDQYIWKFDNCSEEGTGNYPDAVLCERPPLSTQITVTPCGRDCVDVCPPLDEPNRCIRHIFRNYMERNASGQTVSDRHVPSHSATLHQVSVSGSTTSSGSGHNDSVAQIDNMVLLDWATLWPSSFTYRVREQPVSSVNGTATMELLVEWPFNNTGNTLELRMLYRFPGAAIVSGSSDGSSGELVATYGSGSVTRLLFGSTVEVTYAMAPPANVSVVAMEVGAHLGYGWLFIEFPYSYTTLRYLPLVQFS